MSKPIPTIKEILFTADGIGNTPMETTYDGELLDISIRLAYRVIDLCHCYGHMCDHCSDAKRLLKALGENEQRHYLKAQYKNGKLTDFCDRCGRDYHDPVHISLRVSPDHA